MINLASFVVFTLDPCLVRQLNMSELTETDLIMYMLNALSST